MLCSILNRNHFDLKFSWIFGTYYVYPIFISSVFLRQRLIYYNYPNFLFAMLICSLTCWLYLSLSRSLYSVRRFFNGGVSSSNAYMPWTSWSVTNVLSSVLELQVKNSPCFTVGLERLSTASSKSRRKIGNQTRHQKNAIPTAPLPCLRPRIDYQKS